ncbi:nicotinate phosphoribosyltransferase [Streptomyces sp. CS113]|uniref:hypothetical protein n=1 Tax=Streptomyces sp. CS113 TaxID=1982761 RepID=UPI000B414AAA|nr:hypothetical protein [Streptomyces sp. CS113]OWA12796.1 nicotinate phosphoribosyltransferase [Streptomyces sp. CS113]
MSDVTTTDLYEVTMALSYLLEDMSRPATFSLFVRDLPPERGFLVSAGIEPALDYLSAFRVTSADVEDFASALHRPYADLSPLCGTTFAGEVRAIPEGRVVFAGEPLLEVTAPLAEAQLVETFLLNQVSHQTAVASKAVRSVLAAAGRPVIDFSLRRTHGTSAGMQAARTASLTGFAGTSNVVEALTRSGAPIDVYAVGTRVGTSADAPYLDSAYKLVEYDGRPVMKLSSAKVTSPGCKQVFRRPGGDDVIALWDEPGPAGAEPLLRTVMRNGRRLGPPDTLPEGHARLTTDLASLPADAVRIRAPRPARAVFSERLSELTEGLSERLRSS